MIIKLQQIKLDDCKNTFQNKQGGKSKKRNINKL